jgi:hypothetical protein
MDWSWLELMATVLTSGMGRETGARLVAGMGGNRTFHLFWKLLQLPQVRTPGLIMEILEDRRRPLTVGGLS